MITILVVEDEVGIYNNIKEILLINQIQELQNLLTPENATILQRFNLLKK